LPEVVLAPGRSAVLSTPRAWGVASQTVEIGRRGDEVLVNDAVTN